MKCCCFDKDICILCQEYKYYNIYCTRCVSGKICYKCSSGMLENVLIKSCPVCRLETTKDNKWYKIIYNPKIIVPVNTEQILFEHEKETKLEKCCLEVDELCRKIIIFYKHLILIVGCLMMNYVIGLALLFMFTDAEKEEKKSVLYLILVPNVFGFLFFVLIGLCFKACCTCNFDQY
jgi:hypothetical protein